LPQIVTGTGETETDALRDLDDRLRGVPRPDGGKMDELHRRARLAFYEGTEETTRGIAGRAMTADELARVIERAP
jgi:hypothetical protein